MVKLQKPRIANAENAPRIKGDNQIASVNFPRSALAIFIFTRIRNLSILSLKIASVKWFELPETFLCQILSKFLFFYIFINYKTLLL